MANGYWRTNGSVITSYTDAQLSAMESAGTLTLNAWYVASDTGAWGLATAVNVIAWIDFDALALAMAEGLATDDSDTISRKSGIPPSMTELVALAEATCYPRPFTLYQAGGLGVFTQPAATFTSVTASNNGSGKLRLTSAGVHGLATAGRKIYIGFATTGSGLHEIASFPGGDPTHQIDFTTDYSAVSGAVTVYVENTQSKCLDEVCTIPGGVMGPNGSLDIMFLGKMTTGGTRYLYWKLDGATISEASWSGGSDNLAHGETHMSNMGSESAQMASPSRYNTAASSYTSVAKNTANDLVLSLELRVPTADTYINLDNIRVTLTPGL